MGFASDADSSAHGGEESAHEAGGPPAALLALRQRKEAEEELSVAEEVARMNIDVNIDWTRVNLDEVVLPDGEDFGIPSDDELEAEELGETDTGFGNVIVVDNLPVVDSAKYEKLLGVLKKIFSQIGSIRENGLWMPMREDVNKSTGFAFIEYNSPEEAQAAREQTDGYKLDKSHIFKVTMFDDFEKYLKVPDEYVPPPTKEYTPTENLFTWLMDERGRDQFVIRFGTDTEVHWNDARQAKAELVYQRAFWTETFVQWSPLGTYLATVHRQGAAIWGGSSWQRLARFAHPQLRLLDFSPGERFLVTYSTIEPSNPRDSQKVILTVFDVRTSKAVREFKGSADDFTGGVPSSAGPAGSGGVQWPVFRWSGGVGDKFFARMGKNSVSVYETETMGLLDRKSVRVEGVQDFCWSPAEPILALYVPESGGGNQPARVSLMSIPSRVELRQKNLFCVSDCRMHWQSEGSYLAVRVERYTKTRKSTYSGFELFRMRERDIPIEVLELDNKNDKVVDFAWEPKGHRFAIVHGEGPKYDVSIYSMQGQGGSTTSTAGLGTVARVSKLVTLKAKQVNALFWSPAGHFLLLAGLKAFNGQLEFFNVDDLETMAVGEHFMATDIDWDPTGRYVATSVTTVHQMENGFNVWSFSGKLLYRNPKERFVQFLWRPRPPSLLSAEKEQEVAKNLRKYSKKYEVEDEEAGQATSAAEVERRRELMEQWRGWCAEWRRLAEQEVDMRKFLRGGEASDGEEEYASEEVEVEEIIDIQEEIMAFEQLD